MRASVFSRILGGFVFAGLGALIGYWSLSIGFYSGNEVVYLAIFAGIGLLFGVLITPSLTTRPVEKAQKAMKEMSANQLSSILVGFLSAVVASALLAVPLSK